MSTLSGAGQGAALGATVGSAIPGVGTVIGAGAGALIGGVGGYLAGRGKKRDQQVAEEKRRQADALYAPANQNAADLYARAVQQSNAAYQAGAIRNVDASQQVGRQNAYLDSLQATAAGRGPSAAGLERIAAYQQAQQQQLGMVAGARGADRGAARLQALSGFGAQASQAALQSAALRSQEQQGAMAAYANAVHGARAQDIQTSGMGIERDVAADAAGRGAFQATQSAQQGAIALGQGAVGAQAEIANNRALNATGAYTQQLAEDERRRKREAGNTQAAVDTASKFYASYMQGQGNG